MVVKGSKSIAKDLKDVISTHYLPLLILIIYARSAILAAGKKAKKEKNAPHLLSITFTDNDKVQEILQTCPSAQN